MDNNKNQSKVVISLTTIPERLSDKSEGGLLAVLESLLTQHYKGKYKVHLNIPHTYKIKPNKTQYVIPDSIYKLKSKFSNFFIKRCTDYGPPTKIIPTLKNINSPDTIIIVVDDDHIYHPEMINEHIKYMHRFPFSAIAWDGLNVIGEKIGDIRDRFCSLIDRPAEVSIVQHYKSVSYRRVWFEEDFFTDFVGKTRSDDILVSAYMAFKGINKIVPPTTISINDKLALPVNIGEWRHYLELNGSSFPIICGANCAGNNIGTCDPDAIELEDRFYAPPEFDLILCQGLNYVNSDGEYPLKFKLPLTNS